MRQMTFMDIMPQVLNPPTNKFEESWYHEGIGEAWQYKMRKAYAEEESKHPYWEDYDLSIQKSVVRAIDYATAKAVIERYEWLGCMPVCVRYCYGMFFPSKSGDRWLLGGNGLFPRVCREHGCMG